MATHTPEPVRITGPQASRRRELEQMKAAKWPEAGRAERVARAREAFNVAAPGWHIHPADMKYIAEDPDLEYE
jgi:hypothetical protein